MFPYRDAAGVLIAPGGAAVAPPAQGAGICPALLTASTRSPSKALGRQVSISAVNFSIFLIVRARILA